MEIFKYAVLSSEEARSHGAKSLCLVGKDWNYIANTTSDLWSKVTLAYPLLPGQISAAQKWLKASGQKAIDVEIDLLDPAWNEYRDNSHPLEDPAKLQGMIAVLRGSEHRWRSISIKSDIRVPIDTFLRAWVIPNLPLLESISIERCSEFVEEEYARFDPPPTLFGGNGTFMPKIRELCISAVHVDWTLGAVSFQNLRKLEITNQLSDVGPTFEQFVALIAASPKLETLNISGYCPSLPTQIHTSLVYFPALKHLAFGSLDADRLCHFLEMFHISETLETLSLVGMKVPIPIPQWEAARTFTGVPDSTRIFEYITGSWDPNRDRSSPRLSVARLKSLSVSWAGSDPRAVSAFLEKAPMIEEIHLTDVNQAVLEATATLAKAHGLLSLKRLSFQWMGAGEYISLEARLVVDLLREHGLRVTVESSPGHDASLNLLALLVAPSNGP